jgi:uncharacterized membrane protein
VVRFLRSVLGLLLALLGLLVTIGGAAVAFWVVGPDDTVQSGEQHLTSKGLAIFSSSELLDLHGPTLHVDARSTNGKPVFVGVARDFDVTSYLKGVAHSELTELKFPIALTSQERKGEAGPLAAPDGLDWWVAKANGAGTQSLEWPIADGPYEVVIMGADGKTAPDVQADFGIEIGGAFLLALLVLLVGLLLLAGGVLLMFFRRRPAAPTAITQTQPHTVEQQPVGQSVGPLSRVAAVTVVVALATSGCSAIPAQDTVEKLTRPAITNDAAVALIKHYNEVNNKANSLRDDKLIGSVEGGNLLRQSQAGYKIDRALKTKATKPFTYTEPVVAAPSYGSYPMQFVESATVSDSKDYRHLGVWTRASAGSPWLLTFAGSPKTAAKLPDLNGLRPVANADVAKLVMAPNAAAATLTKYLTGGAKAPQAASFAPAAEITSTLALAAETKGMPSADPLNFRKSTVTFSELDPSAAFMTKSGEALVLLTVSRQELVELSANRLVNWSAGAQTAFSPATSKYGSAITSTTLHDVALVVPPKGGGKIRVVSFESQLVSAGGY